MNGSKQQYLQSIRADTAYPVYRGVIGMIAMLGYLFAGVTALGALVGGFGAMSSSFAMGLITLVTGAIFAAIVFMLAKLSKEAALMLVDIADSTVDANSRTLSSLPR
jgi:predicted lipid-binding transport protein (Tim44 family)